MLSRNQEETDEMYLEILANLKSAARDLDEAAKMDEALEGHTHSEACDYLLDAIISTARAIRRFEVLQANVR